MNTELYAQCAACRVCSGAAYQSVPVLGHGPSITAPILGIGQNPGIFDRAKDPDHGWWADAAQLGEPRVVELFAQWSFERSAGCKSLAAVFGKDWLSKRLIYWTNAVRCRTPENASPSEEMQTSCALWTNKLLAGRKAVVVMGAVARAQLFGEHADQLEWGKLRFNKKLGVHVMAMRHYAVWGRGGSQTKAEEIAQYAETFARLLDAMAKGTP